MAELARLGFKVSARTVAKYMHRTHHRGPSSHWRSFLRQHASTVWACDLFCLQTITFRTLYVFFVIHHASRQVLHVQVTSHPTAEWTAQQIVECCGWDCEAPRFLVHDRDSCYGTVSIGGCAISVLPRFARLSDRLGPTRSPSAG
jgi:putative transposase